MKSNGLSNLIALEVLRMMDFPSEIVPVSFMVRVLLHVFVARSLAPETHKDPSLPFAYATIYPELLGFQE